MATPLTALERDLLACVERLVKACETSAQELRALETRSTNVIESKVNGLAHCVALLMKSHLLSVATLADLLREEQTYESLQEGLEASLKLAKRAEQRLSEN
ncbi:hypothetical protein [Ruegeria sp.]|uniref:hypothetical protein n=1 Tax=Ruegeria sp. TaxID=1879320 RepID=UPI00231BA58B|nr:hypothetical protein [Ruegeria sp.]MDA7966398.1 hypothetical protein [Ruegeria sp.]